MDVRKTQTAEMEADQTRNERAFLSHKKARFQLDPERAAHSKKTDKDLVTNNTAVG